jgi:hypothetical protein
MGTHSVMRIGGIVGRMTMRRTRTKIRQILYTGRLLVVVLVME